MTRLQRFRAYMARMNPVADPARAMEEGLYVQRSGTTVADQIALRLELEPASTHLVLGGIGSGKSTELLAARDRLQASFRETSDHVEYVDVSRRHDLGATSMSGVLVAIAGLSLIARREGMTTDLRQGSAQPLNDLALQRAAAASRAVLRHAHSHWELVPERDEPPPWELDDDAPEIVEVPGVLVDPEQPIPGHLESLISELQVLRASRSGDPAHTVFLFDSLDRLPNPGRFREAVEHDLRVLRAAGIGAAVVGPIRFMVGHDRAIGELFDHIHFLFAANPMKPQDLEFLQAVLRRRADSSVLPADCLEPIARASGGVLRDLIALAKSAGIHAHAAGHEVISRSDVDLAIEMFGRDLAVGLDDEQVGILRHLARGGGFVIRGERELSLMETRRVLFYGGSTWAVHPALAPLLDSVPEAA